ncbi:MAG: winged helix-turn-helix domain-containing protein [Saprospiraceae bacterium]
MAFSKAKFFDESSYVRSLWAKALSHPARIIILSHLLEHGTSPFADLVRIIPLAKTTVSQHLRSLRQSGLIEPEVKHPTTCYKLNRKTCSDLAIRITSWENGFF